MKKRKIKFLIENVIKDGSDRYNGKPGIKLRFEKLAMVKTTHWKCQVRRRMNWVRN